MDESERYRLIVKMINPTYDFIEKEAEKHGITGAESIVCAILLSIVCQENGWSKDDFLRRIGRIWDYSLTLGKTPNE